MWEIIEKGTVEFNKKQKGLSGEKI